MSSPSAADQATERVRMHDRVTVDERQELPGGVPGAEVAATGEAEVVARVDHGHSGHARQAHDGVGGAAVVDQHHIDLDSRRGQHSVDGLDQEGFVAPRQHHRSQAWHAGHNTGRQAHQFTPRS